MKELVPAPQVSSSAITPRKPQPHCDRAGDCPVGSQWQRPALTMTYLHLSFGPLVCDYSNDKEI